MARKKFSLVVTVQLEENPTESWNTSEFSAGGEVGREDVRAHIQDAVSSCGGQFPPDHPFFPTNLKVEVK